MTIFEVVEQQRAAVLRREAQAVRDLAAAYRTAQAAIERSLRAFGSMVRRADRTGQPLPASTLYQHAQMEETLQAVHRRLEEFGQRTLEMTEVARTEAYERGADHATDLGRLGVGGGFAGLHAGAVEDAQALLAATSPLRALLDEIAPTATTAMRDIFARAMSKGWNPRKTGEIMERTIPGLTYERAILIARTEQIRAYRTAASQVYRQNADVLRGWRWTAAKTPATCALCLALDGEVFPVERVLSSHPSCRCVQMPLPKREFPGREPRTGSQYFEGLSAGEQDAVLGRAKGLMYRKGEMTLRDNLRWADHPMWGPQPHAVPLRDLRRRAVPV